MPVLNTEALIDNRVDAIKQAHTDANLSVGQLDLSGGIDSAVMAGLLVLALGPDCVVMDHTIINTHRSQTERAQLLATAIGCPVAVGDFTSICDEIVDEVISSLIATAPRSSWFGGPGLRSNAERMRDDIMARIEADPTILGSIRSTLRAPLGRAYNRIMGGGIRHGTGNECEDRFLRFYQKGGDGEVDSNPLAMLSKGEVYQLAFALGERLDAKAAYRSIIEAVPSPDLWGTGDGHSDEAELLSWTGAPFTYGRIDPETGAITSIGTIERVARFLDTSSQTVSGCLIEDILFSEDADVDDELAEHERGFLMQSALESGLFDGFAATDVDTLLQAAKHTERITRHKLNPNCPSYGTREELVYAGILTNDLTLGA